MAERNITIEMVLLQTQDLRLNRVDIVEGSSGAHAGAKSKKKSYDLATSDRFWVTQKGRLVTALRMYDIGLKCQWITVNCFFLARSQSVSQRCRGDTGGVGLVQVARGRSEAAENGNGMLALLVLVLLLRLNVFFIF